MRCTCNAGAGRKEAGRCASARRTSTHRLETLLTQRSARYPHPQAADPLLRAAGVGHRMRLRKEHRLRVPESSRALRLLRPRVVVLLHLPGRSCCCCPAVSPASPALLPLLPSALLRRWQCVDGRHGRLVHLLHRQECPGCQPEDCAPEWMQLHAASVEHDDRSDRLDLRARDADGGSYRRRVAERLPRSTSLALGSRLSEEELHLVPAGRSGAARLN
jgi:hypothetical protein